MVSAGHQIHDKPLYDEEERLARLRLARSENVGPRTYAYLMHRFGTAVAALEALPTFARCGGRRDYQPCSRGAAEGEFSAGRAAGAVLLTVGDPDYPPLLGTNAPPVIWARGSLDVLSRRSVGVVGARNSSPLGLHNARRITSDLAAMGLVVVSGLARAIDCAAHQAALGTGSVAVMAGGLDGLGPLENSDLAARIVETGVLVSECPIGTEPMGRRFVRCNRLIADLSQAVLLIEAAAHSDSLDTARHAFSQGRKVMACPGAAGDPRARGCNNLIRDGAALIHSAADVVKELAAPEATCPEDQMAVFQHPVQTRLRPQVGRTPSSRASSRGSGTR